MRRRHGIFNGLIVCSCAVFLFAAVMFTKEASQRGRARGDFHALADFALYTPAPAVSVTVQPDSGLIPAHKRNIAALQQRNPHCIGWVSAPGTHINYPVMHTPQDPQFYLRRNFEGKYSVAGTPFLDGACTLESENLIIFAHNMDDSSMFADLHKYVDEEFRTAHSAIEFETADGCVYYRVIDVRKVDMRDTWYSFGKKPGGNRYLTLSTCDIGNKNNRVILIAERVK